MEKYKKHLTKHGAVTKQSGFSLIELMISMVIGLIIIIGVVEVVSSSRRAFQNNEEISFIQENARFAVDIMSRELRMAGYFGCAMSQTSVANTINNTADEFISATGVEGYEGDAGTDTFPAAFSEYVTDNTDAILIRRASTEEEFLLKEQNLQTKEITIWGAHEFETGTPLVIADTNCQFTGLFTHAAGSGSTIDYNISSNNCSDVLKGKFSCDDCDGATCPNTLSASPYQSGARIMPYLANAYFVGESDMLPGLPALKRQTLTVDDGKPVTRTEELAIGVEDLEIIYGVDTNNDRKIDEYRKANEMDIDGSGTTDEQDWRDVLAIKIDLVFRSQAELFPVAQTITLNGIEYNDKYMRQAISSIIKLRNEG